MSLLQGYTAAAAVRFSRTRMLYLVKSTNMQPARAPW
jgi:hypothetical protein